MKTRILSIMAVVLLFAATATQATVRTVNNAFSPINPGQYSSIAAAVTAAASGDTLLVAGSVIPYESTSLTINKPLTIIGAGYNPKGATASTRIAQQVFILPAASGSTIMGIQFDQVVVFNFPSSPSNHANITMARNYFTQQVIANYDSMTNDRFINNVFTNTQAWGGGAGNGSLYLQSGYRCSVYIYNNVFCGIGSSWPGIYSTSPSLQTLTVDHNLFIGGRNGTSSIAANTTYGGLYWAGGATAGYAVVTNNIFYNCNAYYGASGAYTIMNNNINYFAGGGSAPSMPYSGSSGTGNFNGTNPLINTLFSSTTNFCLDFDLDNVGLQSGSPCLSAGSDGTNIGPTGGIYPIYNTNTTYLTGEPNIPSVRTMTISGSSTVPSGAPLNVTVTAKKLN